MTEHNVNAGRVYVAGLSAGAAMAAIVAAAYPDLFSAVGVHSGLAPGCAHDLPSALQVMQHGRAGRGSAAVLDGVPLILFQGDQDSTVHPCNADEFIRQRNCGSGEPQRGQVPGGRAYTCRSYHDLDGKVLVERWTIHGASHAWSGGSCNGSFTDPAGPDASHEFVRFFQEHPRATTM
jgi:poly(3-hydroxybutyrate) depolymerase